MASHIKSITFYPPYARKIEYKVGKDKVDDIHVYHQASMGVTISFSDGNKWDCIGIPFIVKTN